ncbi:PqiC family protein [Pontivivens ytuae]|uniref:Membrane integrity-associated transporter subunit PqiC n=1 Tax=Pontivivens ytuae TaxID=2789856 RepID=A0A7S9QB21_9RHOB|nr:PqiC family protein [Pontivivens ytuae]QPH52220.1 membrane integrity-associated transporter subunit PqiC [Pontivivens ytuae]
MRPLLMTLALLAGCGGAPDTLLLLEPAGAVTPLSSPVRSIEVREMSLPYYAEREEVAIRAGDGSVVVSDQVLWADLPSRALTLRVVETLGRVLPEADVAAEPWPLLSPPDLRVEVQVASLIGTPGGALELAGQYFIVSDGRGSVEEAVTFAISEEVRGDSLADVAAAQTRASEKLALLIGESVAALPERALGRR